MIEKNSEFVRLKKRAEYISDMSRDAVMQSRQGSPYICDRSLGLYCDRTWIFADDNVFEVLDSVMD